MVVRCVLRGGFGNQLFQAVSAIAISRKLETELVFHDGWYKTNTQRMSLLRDLSVFANFEFSHDRLRRFRPFRITDGHDISRLKNSNRKTVVLDGYFQDIQYIDSLEPSFASQLRNDILAKSVRENHSWLAMQVRKGDYTQLANASYHGLCSDEYFISAFRLIRELENPDGDPLIVTDGTTNEISEILKATGAKTTSHGNIFDDLTTLIRSKNLIISNSTFGWWGAYLNTEANRVIFPRPWRAHDDRAGSNMIPKKWLSLGA